MPGEAGWLAPSSYGPCSVLKIGGKSFAAWYRPSRWPSVRSSVGPSARPLVGSVRRRLASAGGGGGGGPLRHRECGREPSTPTRRNPCRRTKPLLLELDRGSSPDQDLGQTSRCARTSPRSPRRKLGEPNSHARTMDLFQRVQASSAIFEGIKTIDAPYTQHPKLPSSTRAAALGGPCLDSRVRTGCG